MCEMVETAQGVALTVTGVAQVKIMKVICSNDQHFPLGKFFFFSVFSFSFRNYVSLIIRFSLLLIFFNPFTEFKETLMHE